MWICKGRFFASFQNTSQKGYSSRNSNIIKALCLSERGQVLFHRAFGLGFQGKANTRSACQTLGQYVFTNFAWDGACPSRGCLLLEAKYHRNSCSAPAASFCSCLPTCPNMRRHHSIQLDQLIVVFGFAGRSRSVTGVSLI